MLDPQTTTKAQLTWAGMALFLHALLLFAIPGNSSSVRVVMPTPIAVSILDPVTAPEPVPLEAPPPPPAAVPPPPRPVRAVRPKPVPAPTPEPIPIAETPVEPLPEAPSMEPSAEIATAVSVPVVSATSSNSNNNAASESSAVFEAKFDAAYLRNPEPPYPPMSRRLREEGRVELRVHVLADGSAAKVEVRRSSGHGRLDESACATVRKWRFVPGRRGDKAVDSTVIVPISFNLKES
jgi:protein TonB